MHSVYLRAEETACEGTVSLFLTCMMIARTDVPSNTASTNAGTPEFSVHVFLVGGFQLKMFRFHFEKQKYYGKVRDFVTY